MTPPGEHRGLDLLLEDYEKRFRPGGGSVEGSAFRLRTVFPRAPDGLELRVLLEDYPQRIRARQRNGSRVAEPSPSRPKTLPGKDARRLRLLLDDYDPAQRFWEESKNRPDRPASSAANRNPWDRARRLDKLLVAWEPAGPIGRRKAGAGSLGVHAIWIILLILQPRLFPPRPVPYEGPEITNTFALTFPTAEELAELTQTAPSRGENREFSGPAEPARPLLVLPDRDPAPAPSDEPEKTAPDPSEPESAAERDVPPEPEPAPAATVAEDPQALEEPEAPLAAALSPNPGELRRGTPQGRLNRPAELPAPSTPSRRAANPQLVLEDPKTALPGRAGRLQLGSLELTALTDEVIESALRKAAAGPSGRLSVGDGVPGGVRGGYVPPSPGNTGSNLELLSDPKGVDFRPYLSQILASVRRNWHAVIPESARLGLNRGRVTLQFSVARDGTVPKLVIAASSGVPALDRAAVAGISASNPFPPLPTDFTGRTIRLQFKFLYNIR